MKMWLFFVSLCWLCSFAVDAQINETDATGRKQGVWIISYPTGIPRQIDHFKDDMRHGPVFTFSASGQLLSSQFYRWGLLDSLQLLCDYAGRKQQETQYKAGKKEGVDRGFYTNGKPKEEVSYAYDVRNGPSIWYYESGSVAAIYPYIQGNIHGEVVSFYEDGTVKMKQIYSKNEPGAFEKFHPDGSLAEKSKAQQR